MTFPPTSKNASAVGFADRDKILEDALINSIYGVDFLDVELRAPSSHLASGGVGAFKPVLGNSAILKAVSPYFSDLLTIHAKEKQPQRCPDRVTDSTETIFDYEDECDSDLEDEPTFDGDEGAPRAASSQPSKYVVPPGAPGACFVSQGDDEISHGWQSVHEPASKSTPRSGRRMIYVKDVAASTLEALVLYAYTGKVYFLPPKSSGTTARAGAVAMYTAQNTRKRPMCSPKSMYRVASKMGDHHLKSKARESLLSNLNAGNILEELLSPFSSKHPEILEMQFQMLREKFWDGDMATKLEAQIDRIVKGELPHAGQALRLLLRDIPPRISSLPSSPSCATRSPSSDAAYAGPEPPSDHARHEIPVCSATTAKPLSLLADVAEPAAPQLGDRPVGLFTPVATPINPISWPHRARDADIPSMPTFSSYGVAECLVNRACDKVRTVVRTHSGLTTPLGVSRPASPVKVEAISLGAGYNGDAVVEPVPMDVKVSPQVQPHEVWEFGSEGGSVQTWKYEEVTKQVVAESPKPSPVEKSATETAEWNDWNTVTEQPGPLVAERCPTDAKMSEEELTAERERRERMRQKKNLKKTQTKGVKR